MENREEAMKADLSSSILEVVDPIYEETDDGEEARTEFYVTVDDKGLEVIAERTGLFDTSTDYNSLKEVIDADDAFINVYLSIDTNKEVTLEAQISDDRTTTELVTVPLTESEKVAFLHLAEKALEADDIMHGYPTREETIQYALNQGTGIVDLHTSAAAFETAETTQLEIDTAKREGREPREVEAETVEYFYQGAKEDPAILYAVKNNMDLLDVDEWQATNEATGLQLSWKDASEIINVLYENYNFSPLDIPDEHGTGSIREALYENLSSADEARIYDVLSKYENNNLEPTRSGNQIAKEVEELMFERGEYDFAENDRVRWLDNASVPEPYQLAEDSDILWQTRQNVRTQIEESLTKSPTEIDALTNYLKDQLAEMIDETDNLIPMAEGLISALEDYKEHVLVQELEKAETKNNRLSLEEINQLSGLSLKDVELAEGHFDLMPVREYLEENYGSAGYVTTDDLDAADIVSVSYDIDDKWEVNSDEIQDAVDDIAHDVRSYLENIDGVVAVNGNGEATVIPLYQADDGILMTADDVEKAINKLIPNEIEIEAYGRIIDTDWYTPPEAETETFEAEVVNVLDVADVLERAVQENIDIVKGEYQNKKDAEMVYDAIDSAVYTVKENDAGTYDVVDNVDGSYRALNCNDLAEVISSLDSQMDSSLIDRMESELRNSSEYKLHGDGVPVPVMAGEWKEFAQRPEFAEFAKEHQSELEEIELISDTDRLKNVDIKEIAHMFYPEDKEYPKYKLSGLADRDEAINIHGKDYKASDNAKDKLAEDNSFYLYKIKLNENDMTFDVQSVSEIHEAKTQEMSECLAEFINREGMELDKVGEDNFFVNYALYNKDSGEYVKDESGNPLMHSASDVLTNMGAQIGEVENSLEDSYENWRPRHEDTPSTPAEWVSFAGREKNADFVRENKYELDVMRLAHSQESHAMNFHVDIHKTYEAQNELQAKEKESPKKDTKKFDRTDD